MKDGLKILPIIVAVSVVALVVMTGCGEDDHSYVPNIIDGDHSPTMTTIDVNTFISDSGYTRYYITTPLWLMFDDATEPNWKFPKGLELEQYDRDLNVTANMICDSATYFSQKRLWRLDGNVIMVNPQRDSFLTQQVFWDQGRREVYSDSFIHIVRSDRIIEGYGFSSNEPMTAYSVNKPTGIFPVEKKDKQEDETKIETADTVVKEEVDTRRSRRQSGKTPKPTPLLYKDVVNSEQ